VDDMAARFARLVDLWTSRSAPPAASRIEAVAG
jgi:hypothetical protein